MSLLDTGLDTAIVSLSELRCAEEPKVSAMPELPEVQTVVNTLGPKILAARIDRVEVFRDDIIHPCGLDLAGNLTGRIVRDITRRGKRIVFTLDDSQRFFIHLGMTGRLTVERDTPIPPHTHLILHTRKVQVRFRDPRRFGGVFWLGSDTNHDPMGPEPLLIRPWQLAQRLARTTRAIKNALLDQHLIAGLGNIYVDESLFEARIHPLTPSNTLTFKQVQRLNRAIKLTLRRALRHRGSTLRDYVDAEGGAGAFQKLHRVYDREGEPCRTCHHPIERIVLGGRSTCFCAKCQRSGSRVRSNPLSH
jgi:formamidopyrimidine-DNA glycosylase